MKLALRQLASFRLFTVCSSFYGFISVLWLPFGLLQMAGKSSFCMHSKNRARTTTTGERRRLAILLRAIGKKSAFTRGEKNDDLKRAA